MREFIKKMLTSHSGISSKRFCGVLGWLICMAILVYCTIMVIQPPIVFTEVVVAVVALLGVDSITGIWKK